MLAIIEEMKPKEVEKAFRVSVCWTVRFLIYGGLGSGSVEDSFADCAQQVTQKKMTTAQEIGNKLLPTIPSDDEFRAAFAIARVSKPYLARYYLRAMGQQLEKENEPELVPNDDPAAITLEHVMPQNLENGWKDIDRELHHSLVKRLGNLALLKRTSNSDERSNEFEDKVGAYKVSVYALTKELASYSKWGPEQIAERQAKMANIAGKTWPLAIR